MQKKIIKIIIVLLLSIISISSVSLSIVGRNTEKIILHSNKPVKINNIYIDGIRENLTRYNLDKQGDIYYLNSIEIEKSSISDFYIDFNCQDRMIDIDYNGIKKTICKNDTNETDYIYIDSNIKNSFFSFFNKKNLYLIFGLTIVLIILYSISIFYTDKFIKKINNNCLGIKEIVLFSLLYFVIYLLNFNFLVIFMKEYIVVPILIIIGYFLYKVKDTFKERKENVFIILAIFCGLTMLFSIPPLHVPDEEQHFIKVYSSSNFNRYNMIHDEYSTMYVYLPKNTKNFIDRYSLDTLKFDSKYKPTAYLSELFKNNNREISMYSQWYSLYRQKITAYLPAIIICLIMRLINFSPLLILYSCRFINFLLFVVANYFCIKKIPKFKNVLLLISLLPITLHQAIGINQDSINNTLFVLLLTVLIRLIYEKDYEFNIKSLLLMLILSIMITCCKTIYIAVLLLLLLVPKKKINSFIKSDNLRRIIKPLIIVIIFFICLFVYKYVGIKKYGGLPPNNNYYSIQDAINNPMHFILIIINTLKIRLPLDFFRGLFDGYGWSTVWNIDIIRDVSTIIYSILILSILDDNEKISKKHHILNIIIIIVLSGCIYYALLFSWSQKNITSIEGIQPRYFIPVIYLLYKEIGSIHLINFQDKNHKSIIFAVLITIGLAMSLFTIIHAFV